MKITALLLSLLIASAIPTAAGAKDYAHRYADCMARPGDVRWTAEDCERIAKGEVWPGMSPFMREASEESAAEIYSAKATASRNKKTVKPAATASLQPAAKAEPPNATRQNASMLVGTILLILAAIFYLLPGITGENRHHHQRAAIWVLDIFLGWTVLGWIAALIWASTATPAATPKATG